MDTSKISLRALSPEQRRAVYMLLQKRGVDVLAHMPIERVDRSVPQPLSGAQRRLFLFTKLNPESSAYHIAGALRLRGHFDLRAGEAALSAIVARHEALRTTFEEERGVPQQVVRAARPFTIAVEAWADEHTLAERVADVIACPFDLAESPLLRARLLRLSKDHAVLVVTVHHIAADAWSLDLILGEFAERYAAACAGRTLGSAEPAIQYLDYACFQQSWLEAGEREQQLRFFRSELAGCGEAPLALPCDRVRPAVQSFRGATVRTELAAHEAQGLREIARQHGTTMYVVLLAAFEALLYRYTGQSDLCVGTPVANRERAETHGVVGFFVNTQVLRVELSGRMSFAELVTAVKHKALAAQQRRELPFDELVDALAPARSLSHNPLFQVMFNHLKRREERLARLPDLQIEPLVAPARTTQLDLTLDSEEDASGALRLTFEYAHDLFDASTVERMAQGLATLIAAFSRDPALRVGDVPLVGSALRREPPRRGRRAFEPVHEHIERHGSERPTRMALSDGERQLDYATLEARVFALAHQLRKVGVAREQRVAVACTRTLDSIVAMLAVLRAGGAIVPLDLSYPAERLTAMVEDAGARWLIAAQDDRVPPRLERLTRISPEPAFARVLPSRALERVHYDQLAYVLFTSGSSGRAKPVAVSHGALARHMSALSRRYELTADDRFLQFSSFSFDAALEQWLLPLLAGASVVLRPDALWSAEECARQLGSAQVTRADLPPGYAHELASWLDKAGESLPLRALTVGGEALSAETLALLRRKLGSAAIFNAYGPTEAVITPLIWRAHGEVRGPYAPIGKPLPERSAYVLDADLNLVPEGVIGELYLGGDVLARGYLGRSAATAERFVPDPFGEPSGRLYRTGDLVRARSDFELEYVGRADGQIKLRGYRIELGEIEARLRAQPEVRDAYVQLRSDHGDKRLVAYVAMDGEGSSALRDEALRGALAHELPAYMLPHAFVVLATLPRTANGKVDARSLPAPVLVSDTAGEAPRDERERAIAALFSELLRVDATRESNFFKLGGDSIVSLQLVSRAREQGLRLTPRDVFQHQTVHALARVAAPVSGNEPGPDDVEAGELPLTPIQREFFRTVTVASHHYNQSVLLHVARPLDARALGAAFSALVRHHGALRLRFEQTALGVTQRYAADEELAPFELLCERDCVDGAALLEACDALQASLDLARGPLIRALLARMADGTARLLIAVHHLAVDGVSWRILLDDLARAYEACASGESPAFPLKTKSYASWAKALLHHAESDELERARAFWSARLEGEDGTLAPRRDGPAPVCSARQAVTRLDREHTSWLLREAHGAYRTQGSELMLAALAQAVDRVTGARELRVEVESHGRDQQAIPVDVSRTVGWFTTLYALRLVAGSTLAETIVQVKEEARAAQPHALSYGVLRELAGGLPAGCARPHLTFNYLGQLELGSSAEPSLFSIASEPRGAEQDGAGPLANALEINGQVHGGELHFSWTYGEGCYDDAFVQRLACAFEDALREIAQSHRDGRLRAVTPADFPLCGLTKAELGALPYAPEAIADVYPLTPLQEGLLFHSLDAPEQGTYVNQLDVEVRGLSPARLAAAWRQVIARHPILRSAFVWEGVSRAVQVVLAAVDAGCECIDLRGEPDQAAALHALREREHARGFELARAPLLRLTIAGLSHDRHQLLWTSHHLLLDGWSNARLIGELMRAYAGAAEAGEPPPFRRYLEWLHTREGAASEAFWRGHLAQLSEPTRLASSIVPRAPGAGRGVLRRQLSEATTSLLRSAARAERVTLNTLVQAGWSWVLSAYTGQSVVCFGTAVAGRPASLPDSELMLGMFINTLPCVQRVAGVHQPVAALLQQTQDTFAAAREHEHTPLYTLQRWAGLSGRTLFDTLLVFENYPTEAALAQAGSGLTFGPIHNLESTNYALAVSVSAERELTFAFEYARAELDDPSVTEIAELLLHAIEQLAAHPTRPFSQLELLTPGECAELSASEQTPALAHEAEPVHVTLARRAREIPRALAVSAAGRHLTFAELDAQANRLAQRLVRRGVGPECLVGIGLPRSPELIIALLAVLKAGAAYVPLDPGYPTERLAFMREDAGLTLIVTNEQLSTRFAELGGAALVCVDDPTLVREPSAPPTCTLLPENAAYLIYTSGSTGRPKGVTVSHGALAMHCAAACALYGLSERDCALHLASISFDAAVEQWLVPLLSGARLVLSGDALATAEELLELVERERVSLIYPPTSHLLGLAQLLADRQRKLRVRLCTVGGEAVSRDTIARLRATLLPERIINGYGPTETVVTPLLWQAHGDTPCETAYAPIGNVVGARTAYVLDGDLKRVPKGLVGELYIGGSGLARGYHARPALSAERFLPDPFARGGRMYRTGDLVRQLASGAFEFVGRADQQIKLRGFRIEPGEIEDALRALPSVRDAMVTLHDAPHKQLIGYVASERDEASLLSALRARLPEHMVPARLVLLEALPRTPNGKVDRARLPSPAREQRSFDPPRGEREQQLAALFAELLGGERISRDDDFFALGGDSIVSIQLVSRARKHGLAITPRQVFQHPTVEALARAAGSIASTVAASGPAFGEVPLTPIQAAYFALPMPARHHFNQSLLLAPRTPLDVPALKRALGLVLGHHDALRLCFEVSDMRITQRYRPPARELAEEVEQVLWQRRARDKAELAALCEAAQRSLKLAEGPLLRALHIVLDDGSERLLLVVHHLVVDGVSFRIVLEDLEHAYREALDGRTAELTRTSSYQAWSLLLSDYARGEAQADVAYWERCLAAPPPPLPRTADAAHAPGLRATKHLRFDAAFTARLLRGAGHAYRMRIDELLLTALTRAFCAFSGHDALRVELEGHGREELSREVDTSRTLGWFTSCFPVQLPHACAVEDALIGVKESLRTLPRRGLSFGVLKYLATEPIRARMHALAPAEVQFNYLGQFDQSLGSERSLFAPAAEPSGDDHDPSVPLAHRFAIGGEIYGGVLRLSFTYAPSHDSDQAVAALIARFERELMGLVEHCERRAKAVLTPSDVPLARLDRAQLAMALAGTDDVTDVYRLTPMQEGMLFHALADAAHDVYVTQLSAEVEGLDVARFRDAFQATLDAHDTLRTSFVLRGLAHPVQRVHARVNLPFRVLTGGERDLASIAERERALGFDLAHPPLMRIALVELDGGVHKLLWTSHHLLLDGWSSSLLFAEVLQRYHGVNVGAPRARFRDYVAWLAQQDRARSADFFRARLASLESPTLLARALPGPRTGEGEHASFCLRLPAETTRALAACANVARVTLHTLVQGALVILLQRLTGQRTVAFGSTVAGRPAELPEIEQMLGLFINTLPVIAAPAADQPIADFLRALQAMAVEAREHEHAPLYEVQRWAGFDGPLFDTLLVFENYPVAQAVGEPRGGLSFRAASTHETTNYPLTIGVTHGDTLDLTFDYRSEHVDADTVERVAHALGRLLTQMAKGPEAKVGALSLAEQASGSAPDQLPATTCVLTRIAQEAQARPDHVALVGERGRISYAELAWRTAALARKLQQLGAKPEQPVGVVVERTPAALIALLSVLHAGAPFVALDPSLPDAYLAALAERAKLRIVLGPEAHRARFERGMAATYVPSEQPVDGHAGTFAGSAGGDGAVLAYVLYTSGSTGVPKGVEVTLAALSRQCEAAAQLLGIDARDQVLLFSSLTFDASLEQWLVPLSRGATVHVMESVWSPARLLREITSRALTRVDLPPAYALTLARELEQQDARLSLGTLRSCTVGGEAISLAGLRRIAARLSPTQLINAYGPTEAVITPTAWVAVPHEPDADAHAPIGAPLAERVAYVLDGTLAPLPVGAIGELYLGGSPLARGYRDEPARTAERFLPDPFAAPGARMLRTGDLVRRRADGVLEFLGRSDDQIKLRGYRVELGEVLAALHAHPQVRDAAAIARGEAADAQLVAYVALDDAGDASLEALAAHLRARLPPHAVPAQLVPLAAVPRTPNGKVDVRALPEVAAPAREHVAPRTPVEERIARAFAAVLEQPLPSVHDNFFALGGHSLRALALLAQLEREAGLTLQLGDLMQHPTVASLAQLLVRAPGAAQDTPLIKLNHASASTPLFCIHPAGGATFAYLPLARALAPQRPVYGVMCRSLLDARHRDVSLSQLGRDYAALIASVQHEGPYLLLGWSLGGAIALQVAAELEARGKEVRFLGLVDGFVPGFDAVPEDASAAPAPEVRAGSVFGEDERLRGEATLAHLSELSRSFVLPRVRVRPHAWWSSEGSTLRAQVEAQLIAAIGVTPHWEGELPVSHEAVIRDPDLLDGLATRLTQLMRHKEMRS